MTKDIKQCIFKIIGVFFLFKGTVSFITLFFMGILPNFIERFFFDGYTKLPAILIRVIPGILFIVLSIVLLILSGNDGHSGIDGGAGHGTPDLKLKKVEGFVTGILLITYSMWNLVSSLCNQVSAFLERRVTSGIDRAQIAEITSKTALGNMPTYIMYAAGIAAGIYFLLRTRKKYTGIKTEQPGEAEV